MRCGVGLVGAVSVEGPEAAQEASLERAAVSRPEAEGGVDPAGEPGEVPTTMLVVIGEERGGSVEPEVAVDDAPSVGQAADDRIESGPDVGAGVRGDLIALTDEGSRSRSRAARRSRSKAEVIASASWQWWTLLTTPSR